MNIILLIIFAPALMGLAWGVFMLVAKGVLMAWFFARELFSDRT